MSDSAADVSSPRTALQDLVERLVLAWGPEKEPGAAADMADIIIREVRAASLNTSASRSPAPEVVEAIRPRHAYADGRLHEWDTCPDEDHAADLHAILAALPAQREPASPERLDLHDELAYAEHEVAARLHRYLWGDTQHFEEPADGSDCWTCYDEANGLLYGTITRGVAAAYRDATREPAPGRRGRGVMPDEQQAIRRLTAKEVGS